MSVDDWVIRIKVFTVVIIVIGALEILYSFYAPVNFYWGSFVNGILYVIVGLRGYWAARTKTIEGAKSYFYSLLATGIIIVVIDITSLALTNLIIDWSCVAITCGDEERQNIKLLLLTTGSISLSLLFICCGCCMMCAKAYWRALEEEMSDYDPTKPLVYQQVPLGSISLSSSPSLFSSPSPPSHLSSPPSHLSPPSSLYSLPPSFSPLPTLYGTGTSYNPDHTAL